MGKQTRLEAFGGFEGFLVRTIEIADLGEWDRLVPVALTIQ